MQQTLENVDALNMKQLQTSSTQRRRRSTGDKQRGIVLIEAMVAVLLFTVGVLALVGLQSAMTRNQTDAKLRGDASYLASEIVGTMWGDAANVGNYATANCAAYARCNDWKSKVERSMPGGSVAVVLGVGAAVGTVTITINWTTPNEGAHNYTTSTVILI